MSNKKPAPYDYYGFITQKAPHQYSPDEAALVASEIENLGRSIDKGIFKKNPALLAAAAQRILQVAQERLSVTTQPGIDGASDNQSNQTSPDSNSNPDQVQKSGLWGDR